MALTKREFAVGMAPVLAVWPKEAPPPETLAIYHRLLGHIPADLFNAAVFVMLQEKTFGFPKPHDFIEAAVSVLMLRENLSREWARQTLGDYREAYLQLEAGKPLQIEGEV